MDTIAQLVVISSSRAFSREDGSRGILERPSIFTAFRNLQFRMVWRYLDFSTRKIDVIITKLSQTVKESIDSIRGALNPFTSASLSHMSTRDYVNEYFTLADTSFYLT